MNKYILDTDMGYDPDDLFALLLLLARDANIELIISGDEYRLGGRAALIEAVLRQLGRIDIPVYAGINLGSDDFALDHLVTEIHSRRKENYLAAVGRMLKETPSSTNIIYICIQGASNLASVLKAFPEAENRLTVYMMGGSVDYVRPKRINWIKHNLKIDPDSFNYVLHSKVKAYLVMAQTTHNPVLQVEYDGYWMKEIRAKGGEVANLIESHFAPWAEFSKSKGFTSSNMHDPLTVSAALGDGFCSFNQSALAVNSLLQVVEVSAGPQKFWSRPESNAEEFMEFLFSTIFKLMR